ncbi:DUF924 family protein [Henriciella litoralis]|uniref:DUF924 family protein n=1 Tax=Henriciella litoralis TaxID=568102 RepID=UPI000A019007|nr:DUF924 family protein [Henriciella litoralis]
MSELATPDEILEFWFGDAPDNPDALPAKSKHWFAKDFDFDREIADRFVETVAALAGGVCYEWAARGTRERLAAIVALDQFSRNIFRDHRFAFAHDPLSRELMREGLEAGADKHLSEVERVFFYLPAEHSEDIRDQDLSVKLFIDLVGSAREPYRAFCESTLDYARKHRDVIERFGRFPHRNAALRRASTPEEKDYLSQPGAGF